MPLENSVTRGGRPGVPIILKRQTVLRIRGKIFNLEKPADLDRAMEEISRRGRRDAVEASASATTKGREDG
jgi:hypothetical protein